MQSCSQVVESDHMNFDVFSKGLQLDLFPVTYIACQVCKYSIFDIYIIGAMVEGQVNQS